MSKSSVRGRFVWHQLMSTDPDVAIRFYSNVMSWKTEAWPGDASYTMFLAPGGPVAGVMALPSEAVAQGARPGWLAYIGTPDVDETTALATSMGARVLRQPWDIPTVGRIAVLQDPQGVEFAIFTPSDGAAYDAEPALGEFSWHELVTSDPDAGFEFYSRLFGWQKTEAMDMGAMGVYQMYGWPGTSLGGIYRKPAEAPGPPHWLAYTRVIDSKRAADTVKNTGGTVIHGPMEVPGGHWIAMCLDPQGAEFAVHSLNPAHVKARETAKPARPAKSARPAKPRAAAKPAKQRASVKPAKKKPAKSAPKKKVARGKPRKAAKKRAVAKRKPSRASRPKRARKTPRRVARKAAPKRRKTR